MKVAILSVTDQGKIVSDKIYKTLEKDPLIIKVKAYHKNVKNTIKEIFHEYDCIIGIMASGIMIRSIAPYVESKLTDPAILLIGDNGKHVISLLSGHFGQANKLTLKVSEILDAEPIITTSTDINKQTGIDTIAKKYYCTLKNPQNIKFINNALITNKKVDLYLPTKYDYISLDKDVIKSYNIFIDEKYSDIISNYEGHEVILKPELLVMGIGARRDISTEKVYNAIISACDILDVPVDRIDQFTTAEVKQNEQGILNNIQRFNKPLKIISMNDIENYKNKEISKSDFVMKKFGVVGVCEPCALISAGINSKLLFKKTAYDGVTISVAVK